jgi:hypothetical protein
MGSGAVAVGSGIPADGDSGTLNLYTTAQLEAFNDTTWDRLRSVNTGQLKVTLYNSSGVEQSVGGGAQYTEDVASAGAESLTLAGAVRQDTLASSTSTDGDYATLKVDSVGRLYVQAQGNVADNASDTGNPVKIGGKVQTTRPTYADGVRANLVQNADGALFVSFLNGAGGSGSDGVNQLALSTPAGGASTGPTGTALYVSNGTTWDRVRGVNTGQLKVTLYNSSGTELSVGGGTQYAEDVASVGGEQLTLAGAIRQDTPASSTSTDGDYSNLKVDSLGRLWVSSGLSGTSDSGTDGVNLARFYTPTSTANIPTASAVHAFNGSSFDRLRTVDALDAAPNVRTGLLAAGIGPGFDIKLNPANLGTATNSAITNTVDGALSVTYAIGTSTTGTFTFEISFDDTNWVAATVFNALTGAVVSGNITPTSGTNYNVLTGGVRQVRIRTVTTLGATVAVKTTHNLDEIVGTIVGNVASATADSGNPVKVGGVYTSLLSLSTGQRGDLQLASTGVLRVSLYPDTGTSPLTAGGTADAAGAQTALAVQSLGSGYNGSTWDRLRTIEGYNTAASAPSIGALAAYAPDRRYTSVSLGTAANSTQTWDTNGADTVVIISGTSTTGTYTYEVTPDGTNWFAAEVYNGTDELWVSGVNLTPTANKVFRVLTSGMRTVRARTVTTLGATVGLIANVSVQPSIIRAIEVGPQPHMIGQTWVNKVAQYTTTQTGAALWTPASGKFIVVTAVQIQVGGTTAGTMQLWFGASGDTTYTRGTDFAIFDGEWAPSSTLKPGIFMTGPFKADAADRVLRVTDSAAINPLTVTVWGYETL